MEDSSINLHSLLQFSILTFKKIVLASKGDEFHSKLFKNENNSETTDYCKFELCSSPQNNGYYNMK